MKRNHEYMAEKLTEALKDSSTPKPLSIWQHYKGDLYQIDKITIIEATDEIAVCYASIKEPTVWWTRPLKEWNELVTTADGRVVTRFQETQEKKVRIKKSRPQNPITLLLSLFFFAILVILSLKIIVWVVKP